MTTGPSPDDLALAGRLMAETPGASLAVIAEDGMPYAALTAPARVTDGAPLTIASDLAVHGRALRADGRASLLFVGAVDPAKPLTTARFAVVGTAQPAEAGDREAYLARRPDAELYIDFGDMRLYRIAPIGGQLVAGFGRAVKFAAADILVAR